MFINSNLLSLIAYFNKEPLSVLNCGLYLLKTAFFMVYLDGIINGWEDK